jgi:hypothetical protein
MKMTTRERFQAAMNFRPFDRLPVVEWAGWWTETVARWRQEGLPGDLENSAINRYFDMDVFLTEWIAVTTPDCPHPASHGAGLVSNEEEYERLLPFLYPRNAVNHESWSLATREQQAGNAVMRFTFDGFFWFPRRLFGIENHLYAFYDEAELMHRINADLTAFMLRVIDEIFSRYQPDFMTFAEDLSYNHGPMLSKEMFDEFLLPYYRQVIPRIQEHGCLCIIDSDGDIGTAIPWFEAAGLDGVLPLERQAGVDVAVLRQRHPSFRFIGAFDKMTMNRGEAAMRAEFERLLPVAAEGGLIISCDHQTPPGVSLEQYQLYLRLFREYADKAGQLSLRASQAAAL